MAKSAERSKRPSKASKPNSLFVVLRTAQLFHSETRLGLGGHTTQLTPPATVASSIRFPHSCLGQFSRITNFEPTWFPFKQTQDHASQLFGRGTQFANLACPLAATQTPTRASKRLEFRAPTPTQTNVRPIQPSLIEHSETTYITPVYYTEVAQKEIMVYSRYSTRGLQSRPVTNRLSTPTKLSSVRTIRRRRPSLATMFAKVWRWAMNRSTYRWRIAPGESVRRRPLSMS